MWHSRDTESLCGFNISRSGSLRVLVCDIDYMLGQCLLKEGKVWTMPIQNACIRNQYAFIKTEHLPWGKEDRRVGAVATHNTGRGCVRRCIICGILLGL